jgi:hypothetical protein
MPTTHQELGQISIPMVRKLILSSVSAIMWEEALVVTGGCQIAWLGKQAHPAHFSVTNAALYSVPR